MRICDRKHNIINIRGIVDPKIISNLYDLLSFQNTKEDNVGAMRVNGYGHCLVIKTILAQRQNGSDFTGAHNK